MNSSLHGSQSSTLPEMTLCLKYRVIIYKQNVLVTGVLESSTWLLYDTIMTSFIIKKSYDNDCKLYLK